MRKALTVLIALLAICMAGNAQNNALTVGYCDGQMQTSTNQAFGTKEKNTWVSGAIYLPAGDVKTYAGSSIDSIRVGLAQKLGISEMKVWVRETLDGENLVEASIEKASILKGWNVIKFDTPYTIPADNTTGLYIGYSTYQTSSNYGMSVLDNPQQNALWVQLGSDAEWVDRSAEGTLCLEAMISGDQLPLHNLRLMSLTAPEVYIIKGGTMTVTGIVKNVALQTITGFDVETRFDCTDKVYQSHVDLTLAHLEESEFSYVIEPAIYQTGEGTITVTITTLNEGDDENIDDNTQSRTFDIASEDFTRRVLLEEFTTEPCQYCPRVAAIVHNIFEDAHYKENVVAVCHHTGFDSDWLTIPSDKDLLWYFNDEENGSYAPAIMLDRWTTDPQGYTPLFNPSSENELKLAIDYCLRQPAFVSVNLQAKLDKEAGMVNVLVQGSRSKENITVNPARITVWLVEDNIAAHNQVNGGNNFVHQHVGRAINKSWGDVIEWNADGSYTYACQFRVRNEYNQENLVVAAMIFDYDEADVTKNIVANANQAAVTEGEIQTGIETIDPSTTNTEHSIYLYDLQGRRISGEKSGLSIVRRADGKMVKRVIR
ncbi:MAG: Omp28-related outer membrane protein [Prevotella sp.]|nr:Omp28-related outer membrane protein [Prevotella sp.]